MTDFVSNTGAEEAELIEKLILSSGQREEVCRIDLSGQTQEWAIVIFLWLFLSFLFPQPSVHVFLDHLGRYVGDLMCSYPRFLSRDMKNSVRLFWTL